MTFLRATMPNTPESFSMIDGADCVLTTSSNISAITARMAPGGIVGSSVELGLLLPKEETHGPEDVSLAQVLTREADRRGLRSGKFMLMGPRKLEAVRCNDAARLDAYLLWVGSYLRSLRESFPYLDSAVWTYEVAARAGAPTGAALVPWRVARCAALRYGLGDVPCWANVSGSLPGRWDGLKFENEGRRSSFGTLTGHDLVLESVRWNERLLNDGSALIYMVNPKRTREQPLTEDPRNWDLGWTPEEQRQNALAHATIFAILRHRHPDAQLYWCCDKDGDGAPFDASVWPMVERRLNEIPPAVTVDTERVSMALPDGHQLCVVATGDYRQPLRVERI